MDLKLVKEKDYPLLARRRVVFEGTTEGATPSRLSLQRRLGTALKTKEELIAIRHVFTKYGSQDLKIIAHVYKDGEAKKRLEESHVDGRMTKQVEAEKKADAAPKGE